MTGRSTQVTSLVYLNLESGYSTPFFSIWREEIICLSADRQDRSESAHWQIPPVNDIPRPEISPSSPGTHSPSFEISSFPCFLSSEIFMLAIQFFGIVIL